jgi:hypothetical protein
MCIMRSGIGARWTMADTAMGSVGERTAARAGERHCRDHPVDEDADANDREYDQAERQFDDGLAVLEQFLARNPPAVEEQQRRQEEEEEYLRVKADPPIGTESDQRPERYLEQRARKRQGHHAAQDDGEQEEQDDRDGFQRSSSCRIAIAAFLRLAGLSAS